MRKTDKNVILTVVFLMFVFALKAQETDAFVHAEEQCPALPKGLLRAVSLTNTQCHHLTDSDYTIPADDATAMPLSEPTGLKACAKFRRRVEVSFSPNERMNGLAVVSKKARPNVRM